MVRLVLAALLVVAFASACNDGDSTGTSSPAVSATAGARPLPTPVAIAQEPAGGFTLGDPTLEALPGATVDFGRIGGMNYQIEVPDDWNGRLVMYAHGNDSDVELQVYPPVNRRYLIDHGYAWASSSYSENVTIVTGLAADETAAVWDHFAASNGRPQYTYIMGDSMGGSVSFQSAERYADRYDGALPLCGDADAYSIQGDFFTTAAYIAGVTQAEWDAAGQNVGATIDERLRPMLRDPAQRARFIALWSDVSGGSRPFVDEGVALYQEQIWVYVQANLFQGVFDNSERVYELGDEAGVASEDFNAGVLRIAGTPGADKYEDANTITGDIKIPTLMVQMTGDPLTIFQQTQELRRRADAAKKGDLLVERAIQSPLHCFDRGLTTQELRESFEDLVAWVEQGEKPSGEDLSGDVSDAGSNFTRKPREGSDEAAAVAGAESRLSVSGMITLDGEPVSEGFLWLEVLTDGRTSSCTYYNAIFDAGRYATSVASSEEVQECGAEGRMLQLAYFRDGTRYQGPTVTWPAGESALTLGAVLTEADSVAAERLGTFINGQLLDADGNEAPIGTLVEAYVGTTRCATYTVSPVVMTFEQGDSYGFRILPEDQAPSCTDGADVTFQINGQPVEGAATLDFGSHEVDLVVP